MHEHDRRSISNAEAIQLCERARAGCEVSYTLLVGHIIRLLHSLYKKWDVTNDKCPGIEKQIPAIIESFDSSKARFTTFVYAFAKNYIRNFWTKSTRYYERKDMFYENLPSAIQPDELDEHDTLMALVYQYLIEMNEMDRNIIVDYYLHGKKLRELGADRGISYQAAAQQLKRAMDRLKAKMASET